LCGVNRFNVGQVGFLGIGLVVVVLWWRRDRQRSKAFLQLVPLLGFSIVFTAILFPLPGRADWPVDRFLDIRYLGIAIPLFCMGMAVVGGQLFRLNRPLGALVIALFVTTDVLAFRMFDGSYRQANRVKSPINAKVDLPFRSYLGDYLIEFTSKQDSVYTRVLDFLKKHARPGDTILTCPRHHSQVILFYLGDRLKVCGMLAEDESYLLPPNRDRIAPHVYRSDFCPKWILLTDKLRDPGFSQTIRRQRPRYEPHHLGIFRYGVTRPEVGWRTFRPLYVQDPEAQVVILERVDTAGGGSAR
jgi:hypothetical protein